jgi:Fe-S-cluster containining protein
MMNEALAHTIDWNLDQTGFRNQIREVIHRAEKNGKVLPLPIEIIPGRAFLSQMAMILSRVNCDICDANCCKTNPYNKPIEILSPEFERLSEKYGSQNFHLKEGKSIIPTPCPFLKGRRCSIYPDRPLVCVIYPIQFGAIDGEGKPIIALASDCPEAKRIARSIYMTTWRLRRMYSLLGEFNFMKDVL